MISAYLKATNFCNLGCEHCYLPESVHANKEKMTAEMLLHKVMSFLKEINKRKTSQYFLIWHGGEPLVLPVSYFDIAGEIIDQYFPEGNLIEAIQTSLIPYRRDHEFLLLKKDGVLKLGQVQILILG